MDLAEFKTDVKIVAGWFLEGIEAFAKVLPFIADAVACIPGVPPIVNQILSALPNLIIAAEKALPEPGSGALKSAGVMAFIKTLCDELDKDLSGDAASTFKKIEPMIQTMINDAIQATKILAPKTVS